MPGHTPAARRKKPAEQEKKRRNKRQHGFARPRMEPAGRVVHAPESGPERHTTLSGGWVQRTREVIDIPVAPCQLGDGLVDASGGFSAQPVSPLNRDAPVDG